jgi:hypothetical protein
VADFRDFGDGFLDVVLTERGQSGVNGFADALRRDLFTGSDEQDFGRVSSDALARGGDLFSEAGDVFGDGHSKDGG